MSSGRRHKAGHAGERLRVARDAAQLSPVRSSTETGSTNQPGTSTDTWISALLASSSAPHLVLKRGAEAVVGGARRPLSSLANPN